jgi:hypothetical protein
VYGEFLDHVLTLGDVADALGVSRQRCEQLDDVLLPVREPFASGVRTRRFYSPASVAAYIAARDARRTRAHDRKRVAARDKVKDLDMAARIEVCDERWVQTGEIADWPAWRESLRRARRAHVRELLAEHLK